MNTFNTNWLIEHGNDLPGDVDAWAYAPGFSGLDGFCARYRLENHQEASDGAIYRELIRLRKDRHRALKEERKALPPRKGEQNELPVLTAWQEEVLVLLYRTYWMPIDKLAYSSSFDKICWKLGSMGIAMTPHEVFRHIRNLCKAGKIKREEPKGFGLMGGKRK